MGTNHIRCFVVNLSIRTDRKAHIIKQFASREEFEMNLVNAFDHPFGAMGLWNTIRHILKNLVASKDEYIIICEDDHLFTKEYSKKHLLCCINEAQSLHADILSCGVSGFTAAIQVSEYTFWVEKFSGLQFTVIFRKFFQKILDANFETSDAVDFKLCALTENKFFSYPFLSIQKDFGYSDVTARNNTLGHIDKVFKDSNEKVATLKSLAAIYKQKLTTSEPLKSIVSLKNVVIPTYVIQPNETKECLSNIEKQFAGKHEFAVTFIEACQHPIKAFSLWLSIKKIIKAVIENDDDVIIICDEDHQFTEYYESSYFIPLILKAGVLGCNVLLGGMETFNLALPVENNIFWTDSFRSSKFFVIYKSFYASILQEPVCNTDTLESKFSEMTSNKMALHPFISMPKHLEDTQINDKNNFQKNFALQPIGANERLVRLKNVWKKYNNKIGVQ